jgi:hypothetical protein
MTAGRLRLHRSVDTLDEATVFVRHAIRGPLGWSRLIVQRVDCGESDGEDGAEAAEGDHVPGVKLVRIDRLAQAIGLELPHIRIRFCRLRAAQAHALPLLLADLSRWLSTRQRSVRGAPSSLTNSTGNAWTSMASDPPGAKLAPRLALWADLPDLARHRGHASRSSWLQGRRVAIFTGHPSRRSRPQSSLPQPRFYAC